MARVLYTITEYPPLVGGIATLAEVLLEELVRDSDDEFHFWAPPGTDAPISVKLHDTYRRPSGFIPRFCVEFLNALELRRLFRTYQFEKVLFMDASARAYAFPFVPKVPSFLYAHGLEVRSEGRFRDWTTGKLMLQKRALRKVDRAGTNSNSTRDQIRRLTPGVPVSTVYAAYDTRRIYHPDRHTESPYQEGPFHFLTVARMVDRKDHDRILQLLAQLDSLGESDWNYHLVGDGPLRDQLETRARHLGLAERVFFWGRVSNEDLGAFYRYADLFIMLPKWVPQGIEGFGLVYIEAARSGTTSVGSDHGGVTEAIQDGVTGVILPANIDEAARRVRSLMRDSVERETLARAAEKRAKESFSPRAFCDRVRAQLAQLPS
jgi:glycosyltransferase involved in cell wall biosynthesis